jgi:Loader and inhibitor of phage G40P
VNKEQVFEVMTLFENVFNNFYFDQVKIDTWHRLLKDKDPEVILNNADRLAQESKFVPTISELINYSKEEVPSGPAVPSVEETNEMLRERARNRRNAASPEVREKALAEIRKILNIPDEVNNNESAG